MIKDKGFILFKIDGNCYFVNSISKHTSQPDCYIFKTQNLETRKYQLFQMREVGILEALSSDYEEGDSFLIINVNTGEWVMWAYDELPPEIKKVYDTGKKKNGI